jgi:hypothetical protein
VLAPGQSPDTGHLRATIAMAGATYLERRQAALLRG